MLRSIAELAAYGVFAALLVSASLAPEGTTLASSATTSSISSQTTPLSTSAMTGATAAAIAGAAGAMSDRGRMLFATKGCIGCHTHAALPTSRMRIGPNLTDLAARAATRVSGLDARAYVRRSLRDPGAYRVSGYSAEMPDLRLSDQEIEALAAFLLTPTP